MKMNMLLLLLLHMSMVVTMTIENKTKSKGMEDKFLELEILVRDLEYRIQILNETNQKEKNKEKPVLFYAITSENVNLERKSTVVFSKVIMNIGGHYNEFDGIFVSPISGIYMFSWTVCTSGNNYIFTELVIENTSISVAGEYETHGHHDCGSMTALCKMEKGDHAWIRTTDYTHNSKIHFIYNDLKNVGSNSFMGMLIHSE